MMEIIHVSKRSRCALKPRPEVLNNVSNNHKILRAEVLKNPKHPLKKCLFGCPDPEEVERLLEEQKQVDRERFMERFGFDVEEIENLENRRTLQQSPPSKKRKFRDEEDTENRCRALPNLNNKRRRKLVFNNNGHASESSSKIQKITDFFRSRKCVQNPDEKNQLTLAEDFNKQLI